MKTGDKAGVQSRGEGKGPARSCLGVGSYRVGHEQLGNRGERDGGGAETARLNRGLCGVKAGGTGGGKDCELASDVALPFLGFTSFIRHVAGSSRAVELRFLLFWKHTKSENSRYCGCKGLKCCLFVVFFFLSFFSLF